MNRVARSFLTMAIVLASLTMLAGAADAPGHGWAELTNSTSGLDLEAVLKTGRPSDANATATFNYTGTIAVPWAKSDSKVYYSSTENGITLVKVDGHVPPSGSITWESESQLAYDPPLIVVPAELKVGAEWDDRTSLTGHSQVDWHNPATPVFDGDLSGTSTVHGRIAAKESVTVPAGRFDCYVVETERKDVYSYAAGWTGGAAATVTSTSIDRLWYSPKLGQSVKSKSTSSWSYSSGGKDYPAKSSASVVLARYQFEKESEPSAAAAPSSPSKGIASDVDATKYSAPSNPDNFALVIGIAKYRDLPEAEFADRDAQAVRRHLLAMGYPEENIVALTGDHATKSSMEEKLEKWLPMNVSSRSTVFVYFSGHGAPDPESKEAYLVPWDGAPESLSGTAFPLSRFYKDLNMLPAKRVLVALDSCFSGAGGRSVMAKGAKPLLTKIDTSVPASRKLMVFTASGADQISGTLEAQGHGTFTYYFLKGLNGAAPSPTRPDHVSVGSLYDYLSRSVNAAAHRQEREQNPQLMPSALLNSSVEVR
ncbi:MAG: caspase domain-containing protein [Elusimicrobiota bacterium]